MFRVTGRYDRLVDFGDAAPQIPSRYQQPAPAGRLHRHLIRPVIADDLPAGASIGSVDTSTVFLPFGSVLPTEVGGPRNAKNIFAGAEYILDAPLPPPNELGGLRGGEFMNHPLRLNDVRQVLTISTIYIAL
jgi:hypothetical protein